MTQKKDFFNLCSNYFSTFGWDITDPEPFNSFMVSRINLNSEGRCFKEIYKVYLIDYPTEQYPENWKELTITNNLILLSPEFAQDAPIRSSKKYKITQHVASGIHFTYILKKIIY